ncbi:FAD-dependent oxidoreductase [Sphingobacterium sp. SGG-5]|uniref:FAD-dependent oxidoreductase n=1 Tax=Sphingobacterium sp. SGG-5 TaxID=2710881 RepID=UPI0013EB2066|nr:FAD-dependent oxidoreductase [Sphingobacterium sp. SGG-5]NGM60807.1 FAD-dependent oxidoreductase [Sphingobacterium sp. SGG-5]
MKSTKMYKIVSLLLLLFGKLSLCAKEVKPALLVYGSNIEAFTAAIQSARSNVPTLWIMGTHRLVEELTLRPLKITANQGLDGGIWMDLLMASALNDGVSDSLAQAVKKGVNPTLMLHAMERMMGKEKQLTVLRNERVASLERNKHDWAVVLENGKKYDVRAIVDASPDGELANEVVKSQVSLGTVTLRKASVLTPKEVRTTVAVGEYRDSCYTLLVKDILSQNFQELFFTKSLMPATDTESIPLRAHIGQAVGALVAYCAFFKTTADKVDVRKLQTELMGFGARLLPWKDVSVKDPNYAVIQNGYLATILEGKEGNQLFDRKDSVAVDSVKSIFNQLYSRSQLWFLDNTADYFTLKDLLSFVKFVSFRGNEVDEQVQKDWEKRLKFEGEYDLARTVTRYEFLVLVDKYANPCAKAVTVGGDIIR